jgi:hypothetical protein
MFLKRLRYRFQANVTHRFCESQISIPVPNRYGPSLSVPIIINYCKGGTVSIGLGWQGMVRNANWTTRIVNKGQ